MKYHWNRLDKPLITVVICNYNYEKYILSAVNSALNQTYPAHQIIVVDDGSTDDSIEKINGLVKENKIQLITKSNGGQISAYNESFSSIAGDIVIFLDSDDELHLNALQSVSTAFEADIVKVHFKMQLIDSNGDSLSIVLPRFLDSNNCATQLISNGVLYKSSPASGNAFRVEALSKLFPLPNLSSEKHSADFFCIYGSALIGKIATINEALFNYRIHRKPEGDSIGFGNALSNYDMKKAADSRWEIFRKWIRELNVIDRELPKTFLDFNQQKLFFAVDLLKARSLIERYKVFEVHKDVILRSIYYRSDLGITGKLALLAWALSIWLIPKPLSVYFIKKICNPISN